MRPTRLILAPCSARSRRSLATSEPAASQARRPALTAPARDAIDVLRAGTKERPLARTKTGYIDARPLTASLAKSTCNARPDHTSGSFSTKMRYATFAVDTVIAVKVFFGSA